MSYLNIDNDLPDEQMVSGPFLYCNRCPTSNPYDRGKTFKKLDPEENFLLTVSTRVKDVSNYRQISACSPYIQVQTGLESWSSGGCGLQRKKVEDEEDEEGGEESEGEDDESSAKYVPTSREQGKDERVVGYTKTSPCAVSDTLDCWNPCGGADERECQEDCVDCGARPDPLEPNEEPEDTSLSDALERELAAIDERAEALRESQARAFGELSDRYVDALMDNPDADWSDAFNALSESQSAQLDALNAERSAARQRYADAVAAKAAALEALRVACQEAKDAGEEVSSDCQQFEEPVANEPTGFRTSEMVYTAGYTSAGGDDDEEDEEEEDLEDEATGALRCVSDRTMIRECSTSTTCGGTEVVYSNWQIQSGADQYAKAKRSVENKNYYNNEVYAYSEPSYNMLEYAVLAWKNNNSFKNGRSLWGDAPKAGFKIYNLCVGMEYIFGYDIFERDVHSDDDWQKSKTVRKKFTATEYTKSYGKVVANPKAEFYKEDGSGDRLTADERHAAKKSNYTNLGSVSLPDEVNKEYQLSNVAIISVLASDDVCSSWREGVVTEEVDPDSESEDTSDLEEPV